MNYQQIEKHISHQRLSRYKVVSNGSQAKYLKLYQTNLRLSQAFYPLLSLLEVVLRNALNEKLSKHFNDNDWIINQQDIFMSHATLKPKSSKSKSSKKKETPKQEVAFLKSCVIQTKRELTSKSIANSSSQIIAHITFGFWVAMFDYKHSKVLKNLPVSIFTNNPNSISQDEIFKKLSAIRDFRNRIYHNEPIFFSNTNGYQRFKLDTALNIYNEIKLLFSLLGIDFYIWTRRIDNVPLELKRAYLVYKLYPSKLYLPSRIYLGFNHLFFKYIKNSVTYISKLKKISSS